MLHKYTATLCKYTATLWRAPFEVVEFVQLAEQNERCVGVWQRGQERREQRLQRRKVSAAFQDNEQGGRVGRHSSVARARRNNQIFETVVLQRYNSRAQLQHRTVARSLETSGSGSGSGRAMGSWRSGCSKRVDCGGALRRRRCMV